MTELIGDSERELGKCRGSRRSRMRRLRSEGCVRKKRTSINNISKSLLLELFVSEFAVNLAI